MPTLERLSADALRDTVIAFRDTMKAHAAEINRLNVYPVPDGDTGTNMSRTLDAVVAELETSDRTMGPTCVAISHGSLMGARGNSGVILSQILRGIANTLKDAPAPDQAATAAEVAECLTNASVAAYQAVLKPIEGTILTVVRETAEAAEASVAAGASLVEMLRAARLAGRASLERTPELLPVLKDAGVVDAGAAGFMLLLDAALFVVDGEAMPEPDESGASAAVQIANFDKVAHRGEGDVSELRYEVMYFVDLVDENIEAFKHSWGEIGDSIVVVGGDGLWNCHVHTNDIGAAIEAALDNGGRPHEIRITDLFEEVADEHAHRELELIGNGGTHDGGSHDQRRHDSHDDRHREMTHTSMPAVTCAIVAVSSGDGLTDLFAQLGVQGVISGGQTLNPSTAELLDAVEAVNADEVILLPNNKNIVPVADQVGELTTKTVVVVQTRSMPEALAALVVYDPEASADENGREMGEAAEAVATGEVTQAIRDTSSEAGPITTGDWIGIVRGDGIVSVNGTLTGAATALLDHLITPEREIVTVIEGADASASTTDALRSWLTDQRPDVQVEVHRGGQPLYPYLFGVE